MMRLRRLIVIVAASVALLGIPLGTTATGAEGELGGYDTSATATAISVIYNQPSFGLPTDPTFELRKVHSQALADSGPSGRGLSSVLWPGDAAGNADPALLLDLVLFDPSRDDTPEDGGYFTPAVVPLREGLKDGFAEGCANGGCTYPIRAEAFHPESDGHPGESEYPAGGGIRMWSRARDGAAEAVTSVQRAGDPGVITTGAMNSQVWSGVRKGKATSEATSYLADVDFLGLVHFDAIKTVVTSTSDGAVTTQSGTVTITGMRIDAACRQPGADPKTCSTPIFVDKDGLHVQSAAYDPTGEQARAIMKQYLEPNGMSIVTTATTALSDGAEASRGVSAVIIRLDAVGMARLVDSLPEDVQTWLRAPSSRESPLYELFRHLSPTVAGYASTIFQGDQTMTFVLGSASVGVAAAPAFDFEPPDFEVPPVDFDPPPQFFPPSGDGGGFAPGPQPEPRPADRRPFVIDAKPVGVKGIPGGAGALVGLLGLLAALALPRLADGVASTAPGDRCPLE